MHPEELESLLSGHPYVHEVVVIGVYDKEQATEVPRAYVVLAPGWSDPFLHLASQATPPRSRCSVSGIPGWSGQRVIEA